MIPVISIVSPAVYYELKIDWQLFCNSVHVTKEPKNGIKATFYLKFSAN